MKRGGYTLTELLVTIAIASVMLALLLPAVQVAREASRRAQCRSNLKQIGLALQNYDSLYGMLPACGVNQVSWQVSILPQIDQAPLFNRVDYTAKEPTSSIASFPIRLYLCPTDPAPEVSSGEIAVAATNYLGNSGSGVQLNGYDGLFRHYAGAFPNRYPEGPVRFADVSDGLSTTAAVSEVLHSIGGVSKDRLRVVWNTPQDYSDSNIGQFKADCQGIPQDPTVSGWMGSSIAHGWRWVKGDVGYSTYNHMLPPMQPSCFNGNQVQLGIYSTGSAHGATVNVLFADGHVQVVSANVNTDVWAAIGSRNGSESVTE